MKAIQANAVAFLCGLTFFLSSVPVLAGSSLLVDLQTRNDETPTHVCVVHNGAAPGSVKVERLLGSKVPIPWGLPHSDPQTSKAEEPGNSDPDSEGEQKARTKTLRGLSTRLRELVGDQTPKTFLVARRNKYLAKWKRWASRKRRRKKPSLMADYEEVEKLLEIRQAFCALPETTFRDADLCPEEENNSDEERRTTDVLDAETLSTALTSRLGAPTTPLLPIVRGCVRPSEDSDGMQKQCAPRFWVEPVEDEADWKHQAIRCTKNSLAGAEGARLAVFSLRYPLDVSFAVNDVSLDGSALTIVVAEQRIDEPAVLTLLGGTYLSPDGSKIIGGDMVRVPLVPRCREVTMSIPDGIVPRTLASGKTEKLCHDTELRGAEALEIVSAKGPVKSSEFSMKLPTHTTSKSRIRTRIMGCEEPDAPVCSAPASGSNPAYRYAEFEASWGRTAAAKLPATHESISLQPRALTFTWKRHCNYDPNAACPTAELPWMGINCAAGKARNGTCSYRCNFWGADVPVADPTLPTLVKFTGAKTDEPIAAQQWTGELTKIGEELRDYVPTEQRRLVVDLSRWRSWSNWLRGQPTLTRWIRDQWLIGGLYDPFLIPNSRRSQSAQLDWVVRGAEHHAESVRLSLPNGDTHSVRLDGPTAVSVATPGLECPEEVAYRVAADRDHAKSYGTVHGNRFTVPSPGETMRPWTWALSAGFGFSSPPVTRQIRLNRWEPSGRIGASASHHPIFRRGPRMVAGFHLTNWFARQDYVPLAANPATRQQNPRGVVVSRTEFTGSIGASWTMLSATDLTVELGHGVGLAMPVRDSDARRVGSPFFYWPIRSAFRVRPQAGPVELEVDLRSWIFDQTQEYFSADFLGAPEVRTLVHPSFVLGGAVRYRL